MPESPINSSPTKITPKTATQPPVTTPTTKKSPKPTTQPPVTTPTTTSPPPTISRQPTISERMAKAIPVEIGTRGTVGSLIMKEIEYFSKLKMCSQEKHQFTKVSATSGSGYYHPKMESNTKKKKKKGGSKLLPSMCSLVEVSETNRINLVSGFNYKNLKTDAKKLQA